MRQLEVSKISLYQECDLKLSSILYASLHRVSNIDAGSGNLMTFSLDRGEGQTLFYIFG
jgi:hypothetical protein